MARDLKADVRVRAERCGQVASVEAEIEPPEL
jgi:hypothetical protein